MTQLCDGSIGARSRTGALSFTACVHTNEYAGYRSRSVHAPRPILARVFSAAFRLFVAGIGFTGVAYGEDANTNEMKTIEGSVGYRERIALPPNAEIHIFLEDVARMDAPSEVIATTRIVPQGGPPWDFSLGYDPRKLHDRGRYVLRARIEADGHLLFISTRQIPAFDSAAGSPIDIRVSRVGGTPTGSTKSAPTPDVSLTDTYWKLTEIDGQPAALGAGERELHLVLSSEGSRVHGFSGCNRFTGSYERNGSQLRFSTLATTRKACVEGMEQEQRFLKALGEMARFTLSGERLAFYTGDERLILRFKAIALK
jgi:putative lipoprotein